MSSPTDTSAWQQLQQVSDEIKQSGLTLSELFRSSPRRFQQHSVQHENLLLDYSKNLLTPRSLELLVELAQQRELPAAIEAMFSGQKINYTEDRAALHVNLRDPAPGAGFSEVSATLQKMEQFVAAVHGGQWRGYSGQPIRDVVNIGIGGSDLGPAMVSEALAGCATGHVRTHFVSNVDPAHLHTTLDQLDPATTLFVVASKSFTTLETHQNAAAARSWLLQLANDETATARHFVGITSNLEAASAFGIDPQNLFPMWEWVGGRYSLWSAIGLPIALGIGMENFRQLLAGAHAMDRHFRTAQLEQNMPVLMALLTIWYTGFFNCHSTAVVPYAQRLSQLPAFLQQLYMESLGKRVNASNQAVSINTGEVLWGSAGTNGQHSYFQLLHQGTEFIPVDFIAFAQPTVPDDSSRHQHLLANCFSQSLALMEGRSSDDAPYKHIPGNRPSNTLLINRLDPYNLGSLIALYEHKVFTQSVIWNINAFDQWGVELGKQLSRQVFDALSDSASDLDFDQSTASLIRRARELRG